MTPEELDEAARRAAKEMVDSVRHDKQAIIDALVAAGAEVRKDGREIRCPWHHDKSPSAGVYQDKGDWLYKCMVCHAEGVALDAWAIRALNAGEERHSFVSEAMRAAAEAEKAKQNAKPRPTGRTFPSCEAMAEDMARDANGTVERVFAYADRQGRDVLAVVRIAQAGEKRKTFRQGHPVGSGWAKGAGAGPHPLYRLPAIANAEALVVVEGEKACEALVNIGIPATTSVGGAKNANGSDWRPLAGKRVALWPDNDENGRAYMRDVARILAALPDPPNVRLIDAAALGLPEKSDAHDYIARIEGDAEAKRKAVRAMLAAAAPQGPSQELAASLEAQIAGKHALVPWPWSALTKTSRALLPGTITILAGQPGATKSFMALQAAMAIHREGVRVGVLELEDSRSYHLQRALAQLEANGHLTDSAWCAANAESARAAMHRHAATLDSFGRCLTCHGNATLDDVAKWIEAQAKVGTRVLFVDPITLANPGTDRTWTADAAFMGRIKPTIEDTGASLVLVSHPRKGKMLGPPALDDLAGGASYARAAQTVLWLDRLEDGEQAHVVDPCHGHRVANVNRTVRILKSRNGPGTGSAVGFRFSGTTLTFSEVGVIVGKGKQAARSTPADAAARAQRIGNDPADAEDLFGDGVPW